MLTLGPTAILGGKMKKAIFAMMAGLLIVTAGASSAFATPDDDDDGHKVGLCHRTASNSNPYVFIKVDEAAVPTHLHNGNGHPPKTNSDGSPRNDYLADDRSECTQTPAPHPTVTVTETVPGPTVTETVPGPKVTETVEVPGPTVTETVPGPETTVTETVPGPTVTETAPGPETTVTETVEVPGPTATETVIVTEPAPTETVTEIVTVKKNDDGTTSTTTTVPDGELPHTGGGSEVALMFMGLGMLMFGTGLVMAARARPHVH